MKTLAEVIAAEKANRKRVATVRKAFRQTHQVDVDSDGNYVAFIAVESRPAIPAPAKDWNVIAADLTRRIEAAKAARA